MSTPNFHTMKNFGLYIQAFEPMTLEEYKAEEFQFDEYHYSEYQVAVSDDWKEYILEKSYNETMQLWEELFYNDLFSGADGFKGLMEELNENLLFHKLTLKSGYYSGVQIYVEEKDNPHELDNEDCNYYYNMCRSKAICKYDAEINKINKFLEKVTVKHGWKKLNCLGIFSNGEAIYEYA